MVHELGGWLREVVRWRDLGWRTGWLVENWVCGAMERFRVVWLVENWVCGAMERLRVVHGVVADSLIHMLFYCSFVVVVFVNNQFFLTFKEVCFETEQNNVPILGTGAFSQAKDQQLWYTRTMNTMPR